MRGVAACTILQSVEEVISLCIPYADNTEDNGHLPKRAAGGYVRLYTVLLVSHPLYKMIA
jgi:hypothetical protein